MEWKWRPYGPLGVSRRDTSKGRLKGVWCSANDGQDCKNQEWEEILGKIEVMDCERSGVCFYNKLSYTESVLESCLICWLYEQDFKNFARRNTSETLFGSLRQAKDSPSSTDFGVVGHWFIVFELSFGFSLEVAMKGLGGGIGIFGDRRCTEISPVGFTFVQSKSICELDCGIWNLRRGLCINERQICE
ncbi:unnamed protein product [Moneuplotes crassus]|uniref:Uncharacterized protein n=1 Tax=Euplotes crassus TaxID=5936 RepID=A0AAD1X8Q8_EUPCR|nr:unnamed protein product [Moneuplotes crassus]